MFKLFENILQVNIWLNLQSTNENDIKGMASNCYNPHGFLQCIVVLDDTDFHLLPSL